MHTPIPFDQQLAYLKAHAPRCLNSFQTTPLPLPAFNFRGHGGALISAFQLSCHLGDNGYKVFGFVWNDKEAHSGKDTWYVLPPLKVLTQPNELNKHLFDADNDGYAGELGGSHQRNGITTPGARHIALKCGHCQGTVFELMVRLEYPDDLFAEDVGLADFKGREQELFNWYTLIGQCRSCGQQSILADFNCA